MNKYLPAGLALFVMLMAGCGSRQPVAKAPADIQLEEYNAAGWTAFQSGEYKLAGEMFEKALARAYARDDAASASDAAYNIAASLSRNRSFEPALARLQQAREELSDNSATRRAAIDLLHAAILLELKRYSDADRVLAQALAQPQIPVDDQRLLRLYQADSAIRQGNREQAGQLMAGIDNTDTSKPRELMIRGRYTRLTGEYEKAADRFLQAAGLYRQQIYYSAMAQALADAAEAKGQAQDHAASADLWFRAARSAHVQSYKEWFAQWIAQAQREAKSANATALLQRIEQWKSPEQ